MVLGKAVKKVFRSFGLFRAEIEIKMRDAEEREKWGRGGGESGDVRENSRFFSPVRVTSLTLFWVRLFQTLFFQRF